MHVMGVYPFLKSLVWQKQIQSLVIRLYFVTESFFPSPSHKLECFHDGGVKILDMLLEITFPKEVEVILSIKMLTFKLLLCKTSMLY